MARRLDDVLRTALCDAAAAYVAGGWPILPSHAPEFREPVCRRSPQSVGQVREWWSDRHYGIVCPTGVLFDSVAVSPAVGWGMLPRLSEHHLPVLQVPDGQGRGGMTWHFLVTPGSPRIADLPRTRAVRLVSGRELIPLPPTPVDGMAARWVAFDPTMKSRLRGLPAAPPEVVSLRTLPHSLQLQWSVLRAILATRNGLAPEAEVDESTLRGRLRAAYELGATIAELSGQIGRSPKYVRQLLRQSGAVLRHHARRPAGSAWKWSAESD